jgi:tRNA A-37 threonylcarbamoyl transferase component Bud32
VSTTIIDPNGKGGDRLKEIFLQALDLPAESRDTFLDEACRGNPALKKGVQQLLENHLDDSFLQPAIQVENTPSMANTVRAHQAGAVAFETVSRPAPGAIHYFGDYEILGEIARGGMGIVYKARQKSLNRIVALKMIRAGRLADDADVKRFRTEAEAAANLQHPNIVAIHEIGEHEGQHYFTMDYVEGKDLAKLTAGSPLPIAKATHYVKTIAEAISYAHRQGTLHRDLKPHNVLIGQHDEPRITDFGLAKLTKQDSTLTQEGVILGSPSYMPPEQAAGKLQEVGPQSDVYSIGAVLYQLLTGRAPFVAETAVGTMKKVLEDDPVPPAKLNPKVPEDLETICLKCLQKAPSQRYGSAAELVLELERFLNFEPIEASPASRWRRSWSWVQKNPWAFAGGLASLVMLFASMAYGMFERTRFVLWQLNGGLEKPVSLEKAPCILFFQLFPLLMILIAVEEKAFRRSFRKRGNLAGILSSGTFLLHVALGGITALSGMAAILWQIRAWAWSSSTSPLIFIEVLSVACALGLTWLGFHRLWEAVGMHETSRFRDLVDKNLEQQLAIEWRRWPAIKLIAFPLWLLAATWVSVLFAVACYVTSRTSLGITASVAAITLVAGVIKYTRWIARRQSRILVWVVIPLMIGATLLATQALQDSTPHPNALNLDVNLVRHDLHPENLLAVLFLCGIAAASVISFEWIFFGGKDLEGRSKTALGAQWKDVGLGFGCLLLMGGFVISVENHRGKAKWRDVETMLQSKNESLDYQTFTKPRIPESENVMEHPFMKSHFLKGTKKIAMENLNAPTTLQELRDLPRRGSAVKGSAAASTNSIFLEDVIDWYARYTDEFKQLEAALARPQFRVTGDPEHLMSMPIPNAYSFRTALTAYEHLCKTHLLLGNANSALKELRLMKRLADVSMFNDPTPLTVTMWKVKSSLRYAKTIEETLGAGLWPADTLESLQKICTGLNLVRDAAWSLRSERAAFLLWTRKTGRGLIFGSKAAPWFGFGIPEGWVDQELAAYATRFQHTLEGLDGEAVRIDAATSEEADNVLQQLRRQHGFHNMLSHIAVPVGVAEAKRIIAHAQTMVDQAQLGAALERYYVSHREYPQNLQELVPHVPRLPHDVVTGEPLHYRRVEPTRYLLYSVGWNGHDEEGNAGAESASVDGDWVWQGAPQH